MKRTTVIIAMTFSMAACDGATVGVSGRSNTVTCPAPDAGATGPVCGDADAGPCSATQICCDVSLPVRSDGGISHGQLCGDLGPDGGCPPNAQCGYDDAGAVATCAIFYP